MPRAVKRVERDTKATAEKKTFQVEVVNRKGSTSTFRIRGSKGSKVVTVVASDPVGSLPPVPAT